MGRPRLSQLSVLATLGMAVTALMPNLRAQEETLPTPPRKERKTRTSTPFPREEKTPGLRGDSPVKPASDAFRAGDYEKAASLLAAIDHEKLNAVDQRIWRILTKNAAIRTGNRVLLEKANIGWNERTHFVSGRQILNAMEHLEAGDIPGAKQVMSRVIEPEFLDERSRRRYLAMWARIYQLEGDRKKERIFVAKLVDYAGHWRSDACQTCHENTEKYGDDVTSLDVTNWWAGQRFVEILRRDGDARKVRAAAEARMKSHPDEEGPILRRAYALRAEGRTAEAEAELRKLSWAAFPDRPYKEPIDLIIFP
jgi:hypothetical protein